ncbi:MAG: hypothetical protein CSA83_00545 [Actinomycetales bacterium]|nr:MAG: hypothetical protein CSA83_00545 [Actinomycetales bacterium]
MAYSEILAERIRNTLKHLDNVEEKKMFGGLAFMVNGKMCLAVGLKEMMCRIDPQIHEQEVKKAGCSTVVMRGKNYRGYIDVQEENLQKESDLKYWIDLALEFNEQLISKEK